ncbi:PREDICTED: putative ammonium transporter 3 [Branchiostoma belcheri]|uniref:Ammonium transporter 3 n=1 Tax=Branchiostoma belcheri TaxID=7741 RepID=A0A6P4ZTG6_BRABE|nr:PREDICTED: putative ammonium transporter 3 [Branchiostoma belcheri]
MALREAAVVSTGNDVNIMTKCICSVVLGGSAYWIFGYALSFGRDYGTNPFCGWGSFFVTAADVTLQPWQYAHFLHHLSYVTMATGIVSGAMAGKTRLKAHVVYCIVNVLFLAFPMHWVWGHNGWLKQLGVLDASGSGPVHLIGGTHSLVLALFTLRARLKKSNPENQPPRESPLKLLLGTCLLWCGCQGLAIGSAFGVTGSKWKLATRAVVNTFISSSTGAIVSILLSYYINKGKLKTGDLARGILGSLVGVSGICRVTHPWAAMIIGGVSGVLVYFVPVGLTKLKVDDPIDGVAVHGACGLWGVMSVGIFGVLALEGPTNTYQGMIEGGGFYLLGVQTLEAVILILWSGVTSAAIFKVIDVTIGLRVTPEVEEGGLDLYEHGIGELLDEPSEKMKKKKKEEEKEEEEELDGEKKYAEDTNSEGSQVKSKKLAIKTDLVRTKDDAKVSYVNEKVISSTPTPDVRVGTNSRDVPTSREHITLQPVSSSGYAAGMGKISRRGSNASASSLEDREKYSSKHDLEDGAISKKISKARKESGYDSETIPKTVSETKDNSYDSGHGSEDDTTKRDRRRLRRIKGSFSKACSILFSNENTLSSIPEASTGSEMDEASDGDVRKSILKSIVDRKARSLERRAKVLRFLEGENVTYPATDTFPRVSRGQTMTFMFHDSE